MRGSRKEKATRRGVPCCFGQWGYSCFEGQIKLRPCPDSKVGAYRSFMSKFTRIKFTVSEDCRKEVARVSYPARPGLFHSYYTHQVRLMEERRFSKPNIGVRFLDLVPSGRGGTGRRASFRGWWAQALAGSNPAAPTTFDCRGCSYSFVN